MIQMKNKMTTIQSRNRKRGKESEKVIAEMFQGMRVGLLGSEDVMHLIFSIEVKSRKKFSARQWFDQAKRNNKNNKIPIVVVHEMNHPHDKDLVVIEINDFLNIINQQK